MNNISNQLKLLDNIVEKLKEIKTIKGIVLGGSFATGKQQEGSDIDIGIFYNENDVLDIKQIKKVADSINDYPNPDVTPLGAWGRWVNGGAWLTIKKQRVDFLYKNIDFISRIIQESKKGIIHVDYCQQPAFGFFSYIYCAEIFESKILYDPQEILKKLKAEVQTYPQELKKAIVNKFLWDAEFSLFNALKFQKRNNIISLAGCLTRITNDLIQVIYALNETYFINEKNINGDIQIFKIKPHAFMSKLEQVVCNIDKYNDPSFEILKNCEHLIKEVILLTGDYYKPPFNLKYV